MLRIRYRNARQTTYNRQGSAGRRAREAVKAVSLRISGHTKKSRQGLPRRLVPLRLRRGTVSSGARTQPVLALIWTHATFNEAVGALPVCRANDPRSL